VVEKMNAYTVLLESQKERDRYDDLYADGRIIL
jgi:hypothetical protein